MEVIVVDKSKETLNNKLNGIMSLLPNRDILEASMIGAKWVEVRTIKTCRCCHKTIKEKTLALTASSRNPRGFKNREYMCYECGERRVRLLNSLHESYMDDFDAYDYDDGYSSNGY